MIKTNLIIIILVLIATCQYLTGSNNQGKNIDIIVSSEEELRAAINGLNSNTTILIKNGIYDISATFVVGQAWNGEQLSNITICSFSGNRDSVILRGAGMDVSGNANNIFLVRNVVDFTFQDLTIRDVYWHPIQIQGENGANRPRLKNLHLLNAGEQFIKVCRDEANARFCNEGIVENCLIEFTDHAHYSSGLGYYTNGVDVLGGDAWIIRDNIFKNIRAEQSSGMIAGAVILMWQKSTNTIVERNIFIECDLGIHFGNPSGPDDDHVGGIIRNNFIYRENQGDTGISLNKARNVKIYNNTIILNDTFPWTIEYRYATINGDICGDIRYNLTDGPIQARDGGTANLESNITDAALDWFVNPSNIDLHLTENASNAIDQVTLSADVLDDIDKQARPIGNLADIGADEYSGSTGIIDAGIVPNNIILYQNHPNPFNPSTIIKYSVAKPCNVQIKIYNQLGQEVRVLVNEQKTAGEYYVTWDSKGTKDNKLASGVYFYKLTAGKKVFIKKMLYLQ